MEIIKEKELEVLERIAQRELLPPPQTSCLFQFLELKKVRVPWNLVQILALSATL